MGEKTFAIRWQTNISQEKLSQIACPAVQKVPAHKMRGETQKPQKMRRFFPSKVSRYTVWYLCRYDSFFWRCSNRSVR